MRDWNGFLKDADDGDDLVLTGEFLCVRRWSNKQTKCSASSIVRPSAAAVATFQRVSDCPRLQTSNPIACQFLGLEFRVRGQPQAQLEAATLNIDGYESDIHL